MQGPQHRVLVHAEHGSNVLGEREPLARPGLTVGYGSADLRRDLLVQRLGACVV